MRRKDRIDEVCCLQRSIIMSLVGRGESRGRPGGATIRRDRASTKFWETGRLKFSC